MSDTKFAVTNYNGVTVTCSNNQWDTHIVMQHEIMKNNVAAVKDAIKDPDTVYESNSNGNREVYFKSSSFSTYNLLTKVVVEYAPGKKNPDTIVGEVVTAFPQKDEKGNIGNVIYKRSPEN